ncbi:MAG: Isoleucine-tRNA ligase [Candidatus Daviesbacteria bacterium GW2011_GWA2_38_24]|uniref:Isoleucine--tRNA ligase n=1 Tax=Candidatus Daviesbacteria bacterium GW2011_GWA2_38_24 TaxID=1618422 RepID=A0A0G0JK06_9BACT|nr:MAG: Isoleucine-tRNA ligase [Candidatus Daviesbacteria bacterium GW2011_GWA2_38_24]OGE23505.1 MAG: hypothetical protein A2688_03370 [Candidatus Daviesbacteria bacterium RIFCSPHIGHO2_01_FULL_38_8]
MAFKAVSSQVNFPELEENTLKFWKDNNIFEKSITSRPEDRKWTFLDGPPFITGLPHYGSLLVSMPKDLFPRYYTMMGYRVRRVWGWDVHGLPAENKVENKLNIKRKKDIEEVVGIKKFIEECRAYVSQTSAEWEWYIDHIGRWVDFKNAYKTMDLSYMESVMWVFKQMYDKGYIYKGLRVSLYCPHCSTPISNFEVAMDPENYQVITEPAVTYKYKLREERDTYLLAWSTTPWNKIATPALAVNPDLAYVKVKQGDEHYILGKETLKVLKSEPYEIVDEFKGKDLIGKEFEPHYHYYPIERGKKAFEVVGGDFVTAEEGTGIVTIAAYGEEDLNLMQKENIQIVLHVDEEGRLKDDVPSWGGMYYLDVNEKVNEDLKSRGLIYKIEDYSHSVAHCWRCHTQLFYAPQDAWYVDVQKLKPELKKNNEVINWFPKHFKYGRFLKSMEAAPDWCISRSRYWGSPVPVWECECGERIVPGSIKELEDLSGQKVTDLHKPEIDEIKTKCPKCDKFASRVPEVLDSWIEAGSASFAERHFPFDKKLRLEDFFPPDFIVEYTGQIRAWFYVVHVIATALFDSPGFKNVVVTGVVLGTDGRKMSKNYGNYPDPKGLMQTYGGDALRIYLMGSPVMRGEDISFSNEGVPEVIRGFMLILWNSYKFFIDYANLFEWDCKKHGNVKKEQLTVLDRWILARLTELTLNLHQAFKTFDTPLLSKILKDFVVNDLSTWYIRRIRDRVSGEDESDRNVCLSVLFGVLVTYSKLLAPLAPFIAEELYKNLTDEESVHLADYPLGDKSLLDLQLMADMVLVRKIVEQGHAKRKDANIKLRQPLSKVVYSSEHKLSEDLEEITAQELNVKSVEFGGETKDVEVTLDTTITPQLQEEGEARELMRKVQQLRKDAGLTLSDKTKIKAPSWPKRYEEMILRGTASVGISKGQSLEVIKVS